VGDSMKSIFDMKIGQEGIIKKIVAKEPIKSRLFSFGILKGNRIKILERTIKKETLEVDIEGSRVALRSEEARSILVEEGL